MREKLLGRTTDARVDAKVPRPGISAGLSFYARCSYAFLLAFVFPFICWGESAQAGHPHLRPHFVFAQPAMARPVTDRPAVDRPALVHTALVHTALVNTEDAAVDYRQHFGATDGKTVSQAAAKDAAGQSLPPTLALFLLLLIALPLLWPLYRPTRGRRLLFSALGAAQSAPTLPLPPPRPLW